MPDEEKANPDSSTIESPSAFAKGSTEKTGSEKQPTKPVKESAAKDPA